MNTDYRNLPIGQKTTHGTIKHIYGSGEDFIAFLNEVDQPVIFSERTDEVFLKAAEYAREISASAFRKLNKAHLNDVNDHIHYCLVKALAKDFPLKDLVRTFQPAVDFIAGLESTKRVLARGPNPQHIVYITKSNRVAWEVKEIPEHCNELLGKLDRLKQLSLALLPVRLREAVVVSIGTAAASVIRSKPGNDFKYLKYLCR